MSRRALPNVAAAEIDNAIMELHEIIKATEKVALGRLNKEESLTYMLRIVICARNAEAALRNAKAPRPE